MVVEQTKIAWTDWLAQQPALRRALGRHCTDDSELEDMIQETYLRAAVYGRLAPRGRPLRSWLTRIGMNALADHKNRAGRYRNAVCGELLPEELPSQAEEPEGEWEFCVGRYVLGLEAASGLMRRSLDEVSPADREILDAVYGLGHGTRHTTATDGIPKRLVKGRAYRARQRLYSAMRHRAALEHGACAG